jgi:glycosyltransferase involved in cell wall biosynthesis
VTDTRVRALFVVPGAGRGGAERQLVDLVNGLDDRRFARTFVVLGEALEDTRRLELPADDVITLPRRGRYDLSPLWRLAKLIDDRRIDVVHCTLQFAYLFGYAASRLSKRRPAVVAVLHTTVNVSARQEWQDRLLYRWLLARAASVVFVCRAQRDHWFARSPALERNGVVIYNGVDPDHFTPEASRTQGAELRRQLGIGDGDLVLCCIAGFRPEKGHGDLVTALARLPGRCHLLLAGDGPTRAAVAAQAADAGVAERVHFLGNVDDVRPVLAAADLSVLASTAVETFSMAMLESMAMGVPVIASRIGGLAEAVEPGVTGALFAPGDVDGLVAGVETCAAPDRLPRLGRIARARVLDQFTEAAMVAEYDSLLARAAAGDAPAPGRG